MARRDGCSDEAPARKAGDRSLAALFLLLWLLRGTNALLVQTQFDPDEYWQGLEPARLLTHGRGWLTWEWMPGVQIRSWIHPLLLAIPIKGMDLLGLDRILPLELIVYAPRIFIQAPLLAFTDLAVASISERIAGPKAFDTGLFLSLSNWFMFYCGIRTYTNSFEGSLTAIALYLWPLNERDARETSKWKLSLALVLAAVSIVVRPSALIIWVYLGAMFALFDVGIQNTRLWELAFTSILPVGLAVILAAIGIDSILYHRYGNLSSAPLSPVFVPWSFFQLNFVKNISALYGIHSLHWYFSQCFPALLGIQLPLFVYGTYLASKQRNSRAQRLAGLTGFGLTVLSLSAHKEMRFAFPFIPPALILATLGFENVSLKVSASNRIALRVIIFIAGAVPALYLGLVHQRGAIDAILYLGRHAKGDVDVLLNCHAMPLWGMVHPKETHVVSMKFLDCSPHLDVLRYVPQMNSSFLYPNSNETHEFLDDPYQFTLKRYSSPPKAGIPDVVVTGSKFIGKVEDALDQLGSRTKRCATFPRAQDDVGGEIIVLCKQ